MESNSTEESKEELNILEPKAESSDDEIEINAEPKAKKPLSDKQKETLQKGRERRKETLMKSKEEKEALKKKQEEELNNKIVKKAILIKKKQIKMESILQKTPEEEEIEEQETKTPVKRISVPKAAAKPQQPSMPKYVFM